LKRPRTLAAALTAMAALAAGPAAALAAGPCTVCVTAPSSTSLRVSSTAMVLTDGAVGVMSTADKAADLSGEARVVAADIGIAGGWVTSANGSFSL